MTKRKRTKGQTTI